MYEAVVFLLLVAIFVVLLIFKNETSGTILILRNQILDLQKRLEELQSARRPEPWADKTPEVPVRSSPPPPPVRVPEPVVPPPLPVEASLPPVVIPEPELVREPEPEPVTPPVAASEANSWTISPEVLYHTEAPPPIPPTPPKPPQPTFWEKNPDIEKFIGENLFNKIGIAVLVLGIGFFLKYAIDKDWINEIGRTFIGIVCGGLLIGLSYRMRKTFAAFSSVLVGGGVSVLYFTITIAFQQYHLISQTLAFLLTIFITAFTVLLSLNYDRKELAVIAIVGGFAAPFMVSTGEGNVVVLFTYILILDIGMLILAYFKKWNIVNIICYLATILLFGGWLSYHLTETHPAKPTPYGTGLVYATLYYFVFFAMNVINNVRNKRKFDFFDIAILLSNTFLYYAAGMLILHQLSGDTWQGLFTALMAVFNFVFAYSLYRNKSADRTLIFLLIGLVLSFVSLTAPIQLHGNYITLFWAAETVLLLWLWQKSGITLMKYVSVLVLALMMISLMLDWTQLYDGAKTLFLPFINKAFITGAVSVTAVFLLRRLCKNEDPEKPFIIDLSLSIYSTGLLILGVLLTYVVLLLEILYQSNRHFVLLTPVWAGAYNYLFIGVLLYLSRRKFEAVRLPLLLLTLCFVVAFPLYYNPAIIDVRIEVLAGKAPVAYFYVQYLLIVLLLGVIYQAWKTVSSLKGGEFVVIYQWVSSAAILYIVSASLDHLVAFSGHDQDLYNTHRVGYAILWGAFAFVLIYLGLRWKSKTIRIISISLFGLTLLKLFLFDFAGLGEGGKIAAFISLGVILLIISFMYQRLKKILFADDQQKDVPENNA
ncbi:MAG: DUF2339 domain-containing protein [Chitinophaga sp.]|uniref:DUF2339 domain-containing protein n=1 Tax=Chitinophaga sp. TaxID=1869181 RepID=UPI001B0E5598|nr:DUF2339 domain-containing protein [Chitinophaga sp.]MBO9727988.1 DUF2339 domain-containing protein [Chitinophaga sp.]